MIEEGKFYGYAFETVPGTDALIAREVSFRTRKMGRDDTANLLTGEEPQIQSLVRTYARATGEPAEQKGAAIDGALAAAAKRKRVLAELLNQFAENLAPTDAVVEGAVVAMTKHEGFLSELFDQSELRDIARAVLAGAVEAARG